MKKIIALTLALLLTLACFAGCAPKAPAGGAASKGLIVVGYTLYAPMNYMEGDELVGFDTELAKAVFEGMGYTVRFEQIEWSNKYTDLASGTIDCIWNGFTCNSTESDGTARADLVDFSYMYMENYQFVVVNKNSGITSLADLNGKIGGAEKGSAGEEFGKAIEGATMKEYIKQTDCLMDVNTGAIDFAVVDALLTRSYVGKGDYTDLMVVENENVEKEFYAIGFSKGSELTAEVNAMLEKLAADGTIAKLAEKYNVSDTVITDYASQK